MLLPHTLTLTCHQFSYKKLKNLIIPRRNCFILLLQLLKNWIERKTEPYHQNTTTNTSMVKTWKDNNNNVLLSPSVLFRDTAQCGPTYCQECSEITLDFVTVTQRYQGFLSLTFLLNNTNITSQQCWLDKLTTTSRMQENVCLSQSWSLKAMNPWFNLMLLMSDNC